VHFSKTSFHPCVMMRHASLLSIALKSIFQVIYHCWRINVNEQKRLRRCIMPHSNFDQCRNDWIYKASWNQCWEIGNVWTNTPTEHMFFVHGVTSVGIEICTCEPVYFTSLVDDMIVIQQIFYYDIIVRSITLLYLMKVRWPGCCVCLFQYIFLPWASRQCRLMCTLQTVLPSGRKPLHIPRFVGILKSFSCCWVSPQVFIVQCCEHCN